MYKDNSFQNVSLYNCCKLIVDYYLCLQRFDISKHLCFKNQSNCEFKIKFFNTTQLRITECEFIMATTVNCSILAGVTTRIENTINKAYFITYNVSGAIMCSDKTSIFSQILLFDYTIKYTEHYVQRIFQKLDKYVIDWTNYQKLETLVTQLVNKVIARYVSFLQQNLQWKRPILTITLVII